MGPSYNPPLGSLHTRRLSAGRYVVDECHALGKLQCDPKLIGEASDRGPKTTMLSDGRPVNYVLFENGDAVAAYRKVAGFPIAAKSR